MLFYLSHILLSRFNRVKFVIKIKRMIDCKHLKSTLFYKFDIEHSNSVKKG